MEIKEKQIKKLAHELYEEVAFDTLLRLQEMLLTKKIITETNLEAMQLMNSILKKHFHKNITKQWKLEKKTKDCK